MLELRNPTYDRLVWKEVRRQVALAGPVCVFKSEWRSRGAAVATSISYLINAFCLALFIKFSSACNQTWNGFFKQALRNFLRFIKLALPSLLMECLTFMNVSRMAALAEENFIKRAKQNAFTQYDMEVATAAPRFPHSNLRTKIQQQRMCRADENTELNTME
ncbi:hypothetical protein G4B88_016328 [Cannabis sativa]|uniref:Uncharacterized protein n=1 Tax=Cannabis sativa TaxID=3483 RepID=A0A7J6GLV3_CANSA|nr:hypothetical protein G4B88_016328 [Cannabis sativa]